MLRSQTLDPGWLTQILQRWLLLYPRRTLCLPSSPEGLKRLGLNRMLAPLQTQGIPQKWEGCQTLEQHRSHLSKTEAKRGQEYQANNSREKEEKLDFQVDNLYNRAAHLVTWHGIIFTSNCHKASKLQDNLLHKSRIRKVPNTRKELQPN